MNNRQSPRRFAFGDKGTFSERRRNTSDGSAALGQDIFYKDELPTDCSGNHDVMAEQVRPRSD